ncbi:hypothetical protein [Streptomyces sp. JNUCC 63]
MVRVPFADQSATRRSSDFPLDGAVLLAELLPTAYEVGVRNGHAGPGDTVVVVGAGPVGLATVVVARLYSPCRIIVVDLVGARLETAARVGGGCRRIAGEDDRRPVRGTGRRLGHRGVR